MKKTLRFLAGRTGEHSGYHSFFDFLNLMHSGSNLKIHSSPITPWCSTTLQFYIGENEVNNSPPLEWCPQGGVVVLIQSPSNGSLTKDENIIKKMYCHPKLVDGVYIESSTLR